MPTLWTGGGYSSANAQRIRAWAAHYRAKGCSPSKADECAWRKQRTSSWPPT